MIIGTSHRYLFVELPLTGSTAVAKELVENYGGRPILRKHSTYQDFLRSRFNDCGGYFVFAGIRHPLDQVVSHYFKLKSDHKGKFSRGLQSQQVGGLHAWLFRLQRRAQFRLVSSGELDFESFLRRFYPRPYSNWSVLSHKQFDTVLRFENLAHDFEAALRGIGLVPLRPLPIRNKTGERGEWTSYYGSPSVRARAKWVFAPFMQYWGYEFPAEWGAAAVTPIHKRYYDLLTAVRRVYWTNLRYRV